MLTFSEALVQLKAGEDMRWRAWPPKRFVRAVVKAGVPSLVLHQIDRDPATPDRTPYKPTDAELFGQDWTRT